MHYEHNLTLILTTKEHNDTRENIITTIQKIKKLCELCALVAKTTKHEKLKTGMAEFMAKFKEHDHHGFYIFWCYPFNFDDINATWIIRFNDQ